MSYIQKIEAALKERGITAKKMLTDLGYSDNLLSQWKKGSEPSALKLQRISKYLELSLDDLFLPDSAETSQVPPEQLTASFSDRLNAILSGNNISIRELERKLGVGSGFIQHLKLGRSMPSANLLVKLAAYLNVSCDYLLTGEKTGKAEEMPSDDEMELLDEYRQLDLQERRIILGKIAEMNYNKRGKEEITEEIGIHFPVDRSMARKVD